MYLIKANFVYIHIYMYHTYIRIPYTVCMIKVPQQIFGGQTAFVLWCKESEKQQLKFDSPVEFSAPFYSRAPLFFLPLITELLLGKGRVSLPSYCPGGQESQRRES